MVAGRNFMDPKLVFLHNRFAYPHGKGPVLPVPFETCDDVQGLLDIPTTYLPTYLLTLERERSVYKLTGWCMQVVHAGDARGAGKVMVLNFPP